MYEAWRMKMQISHDFALCKLQERVHITEGGKIHVYLVLSSKQIQRFFIKKSLQQVYIGKYIAFLLNVIIIIYQQ